VNVVDSCMETTSADWVFSVTVVSVLVALIVGLTWLALFSTMVQPPDPLSKETVSPRRKWAGRAWWVWSAIVVYQTLYSSWSTRHEPHEVLIRSIALATMAYPVVGVVIMVRRFRRTGQRPAPHRAPLGMFWLLPVLFLIAVVLCGWSIHTQIDSMVPCRAHGRSPTVNTGA